MALIESTLVITAYALELIFLTGFLVLALKNPQFFPESIFVAYLALLCCRRLVTARLVALGALWILWTE